MGIVGEVRGVLNSNERASVKFTKLMKVLVAFVRRYSTRISVASIALVGLRILSYYYKASPESLEKAAKFLEKRTEAGDDGELAKPIESVLKKVMTNASSTESKTFVGELGKPVERVLKEMTESATSESIKVSDDVLGNYSLGYSGILASLTATIISALFIVRSLPERPQTAPIRSLPEQPRTAPIRPAASPAHSGIKPLPPPASVTDRAAHNAHRQRYEGVPKAPEIPQHVAPKEHEKGRFGGSTSWNLNAVPTTKPANTLVWKRIGANWEKPETQ